MTRASGLDLRVLIVAEHASAQFGGEAILPLHYFRVLRSRGIEAWLIVHARTRDELAQLFGNDARRIHFIPDTRMHRWLERHGKLLPGTVRHFTSRWVSRLITQVMARRVARRLVRRHHINVVHQPIPVSPKETSVLYNLGAPVVIGPMNGGMEYPSGFGKSEGGGGNWTTTVARRIADILNRLLPGKHEAHTLLVANDRTRRALPVGVRGRVCMVVENGVDLSLWAPAQRQQKDGPVRFVFSGRLVDWKAADLLIEAFKGVVAQLPATLDILGDGPERAALQAQVARERLENAVIFHGWKSQPQCARHLQAADVFVLPSIYECGGAAVLEAMASGLPVIAADWGGPADYLDEICGILVPLRSPSQFVSDVREAMLRLARDADLRQSMGRAGRERVIREFDWERKVDKILEIYTEAARRGTGLQPVYGYARVTKPCHV